MRPQARVAQVAPQHPLRERLLAGRASNGRLAETGGLMESVGIFSSRFSVFSRETVQHFSAETGLVDSWEQPSLCYPEMRVKKLLNI